MNDAKDNNPWLAPINFITLGLFFTLLSIDFLYLQYILPPIGALFLYLGFRTLRKCNVGFRIAWMIVTVQLFFQLVQLVTMASPVYTVYQNISNSSMASIIYQIVILLVLRYAIRDIFQKNKITPLQDPIILGIIWIVVNAVCEYLQIKGNNFLFAFLMVFLLKILFALNKVGVALDDVTDLFVKAPVILSNKALVKLYLIGGFVLVLGCCIAFNHIILDSSKQITITDSDTRTKLIELGFPKEVMKDITDKDIDLLNEAIKVNVSSETLSFKPDSLTLLLGNIGKNTNTTIEKCNMKASTVYIELPNNLIYVIVHFNWMNQKVNWQDGFTIWGADKIDLLNGVLLYWKSQKEYTAPIPRLKCETAKLNSFFGEMESKQISGAVSYPFHSENQRGYIFYKYQLDEKNLYGRNCLNYIHYTQPFRFPYEETEKRIMLDMFNDQIRQHFSDLKGNVN